MTEYLSTDTKKSADSAALTGTNHTFKTTARLIHNDIHCKKENFVLNHPVCPSYKAKLRNHI